MTTSAGRRPSALRSTTFTLVSSPTHGSHRSSQALTCRRRWPEIFTGRDMASTHAGLGIEDGDFDAVVGHLAGTLTGLGVPEDMIGQIGGALAPLRDDIVTTRSLPPHHFTSWGGCDREPPHGWIDGR